jgi:hypothetical protein
MAGQNRTGDTTIFSQGIEAMVWPWLRDFPDRPGRRVAVGFLWILVMPAIC